MVLVGNIMHRDGPRKKKNCGCLLDESKADATLPIYFRRASIPRPIKSPARWSASAIYKK